MLRQGLQYAWAFLHSTSFSIKHHAEMRAREFSRRLPEQTLNEKLSSARNADCGYTTSADSESAVPRTAARAHRPSTPGNGEFPSATMLDAIYHDGRQCVVRSIGSD
jgi:hypothetical protein